MHIETWNCRPTNVILENGYSGSDTVRKMSFIHTNLARKENVNSQLVYLTNNNNGTEASEDERNHRAMRAQGEKKMVVKRGRKTNYPKIGGE